MKVLLVESDPAQARLLLAFLEVSGKKADTSTYCTRLDEAMNLLQRQSFDVLLINPDLPDSLPGETLRRLLEVVGAIPIVVQAGLDDEETAVAAVNAGAQDYLIQGQITGALLVRTLRYAIERRRAQEERDHLIAQLREALQKVRTLSGLLPICSRCKKIRDDEGYWHQLESYIQEHTAAEFSHSLCPDCAVEVYPEFFGQKGQVDLPAPGAGQDRSTVPPDKEEPSHEPDQGHAAR